MRVCPNTSKNCPKTSRNCPKTSRNKHIPKRRLRGFAGVCLTGVRARRYPNRSNTESAETAKRTWEEAAGLRVRSFILNYSWLAVSDTCVSLVLLDRLVSLPVGLRQAPSSPRALGARRRSGAAPPTCPRQACQRGLAQAPGGRWSRRRLAARSCKTHAPTRRTRRSGERRRRGRKRAGATGLVWAAGRLEGTCASTRGVPEAVARGREGGRGAGEGGRGEAGAWEEAAARAGSAQLRAAREILKAARQAAREQAVQTRAVSARFGAQGAESTSCGDLRCVNRAIARSAWAPPRSVNSESSTRDPATLSQEGLGLAEIQSQAQ